MSDMIVRCTSRLLELMRTKSIAEIKASSEDWYGTSFWLEGRKCVILVHAATLYSALALDVRVGDLRPPGGFVFTRLSELSTGMDLPEILSAPSKPAMCGWRRLPTAASSVP